MLATEDQATPTTERAPRGPMQENWAQNERMRHIPPLSWIVQKLDGDLRKRIEKLFAAYSSLPGLDPRHAPLEEAFRAVCHAVDRVAETARRTRGGSHPPADLANRISWAISHAVGNLTASDAETFGRRFPFQTFERSNAEPLWAAMLAVIDRVRRVETLVREVDPNIDERLYEGMVVLNEPLRADPIAL
jgi:hypothetical protein